MHDPSFVARLACRGGRRHRRDDCVIAVTSTVALPKSDTRQLNSGTCQLNDGRRLDRFKARRFCCRRSGALIRKIGQEGIRCVSPFRRRGKSGAAPATVGGEFFSEVPLGFAVRSLGRRGRAITREPGDLPERSHPAVVRGARTGRTSAAVTNQCVTCTEAALAALGRIPSDNSFAGTRLVIGAAGFSSPRRPHSGFSARHRICRPDGNFEFTKSLILLSWYGKCNVITLRCSAGVDVSRGFTVRGLEGRKRAPREPANRSRRSRPALARGAQTGRTSAAIPDGTLMGDRHD